MGHLHPGAAEGQQSPLGSLAWERCPWPCQAVGRRGSLRSHPPQTILCPYESVESELVSSLQSLAKNPTLAWGSSSQKCFTELKGSCGNFLL